MSECSPSVTMQNPLDDEDNIGTVGKVLAGTYVHLTYSIASESARLLRGADSSPTHSEVRLVNPVTFEDVAVGEEGELWVKGPQTMM